MAANASSSPGARSDLECPRCRQVATLSAARRGRCTGCGAALVATRPSTQEMIRAYIKRHPAAPAVPPAAEPIRPD